VSAAFKTVFAQVSAKEIHAQWDQVAAMLENRFAKGTVYLPHHGHESLAYIRDVDP